MVSRPFVHPHLTPRGGHRRGVRRALFTAFRGKIGGVLSFDAPWAAGAGLIAGVLTMTALYLAIGLFPSVVRLDVVRAAGRAVGAGRAPGVYYAGMLIFLAGTTAAGLIHAGLHQAFDVETNVSSWALLFGVGHWILNGFVLGWLGPPDPDERASLRSAGYFALDLPIAAVLVFLGVHLLYAAAFAAFYDGLR